MLDDRSQVSYISLIIDSQQLAEGTGHCDLDLSEKSPVPALEPRVDEVCQGAGQVVGTPE